MPENAQAKEAWGDYLAMGEGRSLEALGAVYRGRTGHVPTRQVSTLKRWSTRYLWQSRLLAIADQEQAARERAYQRARSQVMDDGLALDFERVRMLKGMLAMVAKQFAGMADNWKRPLIPDEVDAAVKLTAAVDRLSKAIAEEKGDRVKQVRFTGDKTLAWARGWAQENGVDEAETLAVAQQVIEELNGR